VFLLPCPTGNTTSQGLWEFKKTLTDSLKMVPLGLVVGRGCLRLPPVHLAADAWRERGGQGAPAGGVLTGAGRLSATVLYIIIIRIMISKTDSHM
jgi:hypothetical protein